MDSGKIKKLAEGARDALRNEVSGRLDAVLAHGSRERLEGRSRNAVERIERDIAEVGREKVVDRAAYTWFNRLCALRFMDANGYTTTPVVTPRPGATQPAILADAAQGVFDLEYTFSEGAKQRVTGLLTGAIPSSNAQEEAYAAILAAVCERYARPMPYLFEEEVASSLLMPQGLLSQGSILSRIVSQMDDEACRSVEVLGWLYQFYIAERKDEYFASKRKATAEDIAPATQLFTPNWIVRYLAENSLGRLWMLNNPDSALVHSMEYYIAPEGDGEFPEIPGASEIRVLDPACGSGHILVYAFDLLYKMYEEEGWLPEDIPAMILENNLSGLEIDQRAAEIACFALEMKAREKDPSFFDRNVDANVTVLEPVRLVEGEFELVPSLCLKVGLLDAMAHLDEIGSLYVPDPSDEIVIAKELSKLEGKEDIFSVSVRGKLEKMLEMVRALAGGYHAAIANPPYLGGFADWMNGWIKSNYPEEKGDTCTCFITRGFNFLVYRGYNAMITMQSWMFKSTYEKMRAKLLHTRDIVTMAHLGSRAFDSIAGEVVTTTATVFSEAASQIIGTYVRLVDQVGEFAKSVALREAIHNPSCGWLYKSGSQKFRAIPGSPIAYWASETILSSFANGIPLYKCLEARQGFTSGNNARFLRIWYEVSWNRTTLSESGVNKWFPCDKGGSYRKWYGNNEFVANWENDGYELRHYSGATLRNSDFYLHEAFSWSDVSSGSISTRLKDKGFIYEHCSDSLFADRSTLLQFGSFLNSSTAESFLKILAPAMKFEVGQIRALPILFGENNEQVISLAQSNVDIAKQEWDSFEVSWDFRIHPMALCTSQPSTIEAEFLRWQIRCQEWFKRMKENEEELNRIFARVYCMVGEVPAEVPDDKVSVRCADLARDIKSLVSYGIGCIMGRYSAEKPGLILANAESSIMDFVKKIPLAKMLPDDDGILPILDGEWFEDDIVGSFYRWLASVYGEETLDQNVAFIEKVLGKSLRKYFVNDFYADHCSTYSVQSTGKRPIYWLFQSPRKSFQCLVYLHRYNESTVGDILTKYLRPYQEKLRARVSVLERSSRAADLKEADKLKARIAELETWEKDVIYPLAHERIKLDLDDGIKVNYNKFPRALAKVPGLSEWK